MSLTAHHTATTTVSVSWSDNWFELGDDDYATNGDVTITNGRLQIRGTGNGAFRQLDLSMATSATLSFDFISVENGNDDFVVEVSHDSGASFTQLELISPTGTGQTVAKSYQLQEHISLTANTIIRFRVAQGFAGPGQFASVDNVQVTFDNGGSSGDGDPEPSSSETIRDEFNSTAYSNNDGSVNWTGNWSEINDNGSPTSGNVIITNGRLQLWGTGHGIRRKFNLSAVASATLSFDFVSVDNGNDYFVVEASHNGGASFTTLEMIAPTGNGQSVAKSYQLEDYISLTDNVAIRFRVMQNFGASGEFASVDNVQISFDYQGSAGGSSNAGLAQTIRDEFNNLTYNNSDGSKIWSTNWQELGEADGPTYGQVVVESGWWCAATGCMTIGGYGASINGRGLKRTADLSEGSAASLTFNYRRTGGSNSTTFVTLSVSPNEGETWHDLATYYLNSNDDGNIAQEFDLTPYLSDDFQIRFLGSGQIPSSYENYLDIDDLEISLSPPKTQAILL